MKEILISSGDPIINLWSFRYLQKKLRLFFVLIIDLLPIYDYLRWLYSLTFIFLSECHLHGINKMYQLNLKTVKL